MTAPRNPFTYPGQITVDTLTDLLAFHRATFGGYRMEDGGGDGGSGGGGTGGSGGDGDKGGKGGKGGDGSSFTPITSQEELDKRLGERLARERAKFADYEDLKAAKAEFDKIREDAKTEQQKAVDAARKEGETSALQVANARLVGAEARALAAEAKFRNPALAVRALDLQGVKVGQDGTVDAEAIKAKLKELSDAEPYLIDDGKPGRPKPDSSQGGSRGKGDFGAEGRAQAEARFVKKTA